MAKAIDLCSLRERITLSASCSCRSHCRLCDDLAAIDLNLRHTGEPLVLEKEALQDTFGQILTIVILLEFNHSIYVAFDDGRTKHALLF
jgi:hypothetical protein